MLSLTAGSVITSAHKGAAHAVDQRLAHVRSAIKHKGAIVLIATLPRSEFKLWLALDVTAVRLVM